MKLVDKVAVVTGAGRGLGRSIALALAREGAQLCLISRTMPELKTLAEQIKNDGGTCLVIEGDISRQETVVDMVDRIEKQFSSVDILVNNASVIGPARFFQDTDFESWNQTLNINLSGAFYLLRLIVPLMAYKGRGKIINISSGLGQMPFPRFCAYSVSKAGMIQLTRSLAAELSERDIQVNAIDPGVMDTSMQEKIRALGPDVLGKAMHQQFVEYKKTGRLKNPDRVARLAVFLASEESDNLNGYNGTLDDYAELGWRSSD